MIIDEIERYKKHNKKIKDLSQKIKSDLLIEIPSYVVDEILCKGTRENIIALTNLARINNRITNADAYIFINSIDKYLVN